MVGMGFSPRSSLIRRNVGALRKKGFGVFIGFKIVDEDAVIAQDSPKPPGWFTSKSDRLFFPPEDAELVAGEGGATNVLYIDDSLKPFLVNLEKYVLVRAPHLFSWLVVIFRISPSRSFSGSMPTGCYLCMIRGIGCWASGI